MGSEPGNNSIPDGAVPIGVAFGLGQNFQPGAAQMQIIELPGMLPKQWLLRFETVGGIFAFPVYAEHLREFARLFQQTATGLTIAQGNGGLNGHKFN